MFPRSGQARGLLYPLARRADDVLGDENGPADIVVLRSTEQTLDRGWRIEGPARRVLSDVEQRAATLEIGELVVDQVERYRLALRQGESRTGTSV